MKRMKSRGRFINYTGTPVFYHTVRDRYFSMTRFFGSSECFSGRSQLPGDPSCTSMRGNENLGAPGRVIFGGEGVLIQSQGLECRLSPAPGRACRVGVPALLQDCLLGMDLCRRGAPHRFQLRGHHTAHGRLCGNRRLRTGGDRWRD